MWFRPVKHLCDGLADALHSHHLWNEFVMELFSLITRLGHVGDLWLDDYARSLLRLRSVRNFKLYLGACNRLKLLTNMPNIKGWTGAMRNALRYPARRCRVFGNRFAYHCRHPIKQVPELFVLFSKPLDD